jgi:hypothetical protein
MKTSTSSSPRPLRDELSGMWTWIKHHRLLVGSAAIVVAGLALGWNWLAAAGVLPFLYFLPCALMMGMCMKGMGSGKSGNAQDKQDEPQADSDLAASPASLPAHSSQQLIEEKHHA